jgi:hypothetical protein
MVKDLMCKLHVNQNNTCLWLTGVFFASTSTLLWKDDILLSNRQSTCCYCGISKRLIHCLLDKLQRLLQMQQYERLPSQETC